MNKLLLAETLALAFAATGAFADVAQTNAQAKKIAAPIMDNILKGMAEEKYELYVRDFDEVTRKAVDQDEFRKVTKMTKDIFGDYKSRMYLGFLNREKMTIVLWRAKFTKTDDDVLIKLVLSKKGDEIKVSGLWFQ